MKEPESDYGCFNVLCAVALAIVLMALLVSRIADYDKRCVAAGGHVVTGLLSLSQNCVTPDGRILELKDTP